MRQLKTIRLVLILVTFILGTLFSLGQQSYELDFVKSVQYSNNQITTVLKVTPKVKDFKMILSMKITYNLGEGSKVVDLQKQKENNIQVVLYGKNLAEKDPKLYDLIKDSINLNTSEDIRLIVFNFFNLTKKPVDNMSITYGLWEGENAENRKEKTFNFKVDKVEE